MKRIVFFLAVLVVGCDMPQEYKWVIERGDRPAEEIQRDFNTMGIHGWLWMEDNDLESSGHYVYFSKTIKESESLYYLHALARDLNAHLDTAKE